MSVGQNIVRYKGWISIVVVLVLGISGAAYYYKNKTAAPAVVTTVAVERGKISSVVSATGTITPVNSVDISSKITGLIEKMNVQENDLVTAGQVLLELDDKHLRTQVDQARAKLVNATAVYERTKRLAEMGAVATQSYDNSLSDYNVAQAAYNDAVSQLEDTIIRSPISGQVIGKPTPAGQAVAPGVSTPMVLLTVADMSAMQIETQVDESDIGKIQLGLKATFTVDAYPDKVFTGVVSSISQKATIVSNVVYYKVVINVDAPENLLKPTMTARVAVNVAEHDNTLTVPLAAVKAQNGQKFVMAIKNGAPQQVAVKTGLASDDRIEIVSGLTTEDRVVVANTKAQAASTRSGMMPPPPPGGM